MCGLTINDDRNELMAAAAGLRNLAADHQNLAPELVELARRVEAAAWGFRDTAEVKRLGDAAERVLRKIQ